VSFAVTNIDVKKLFYVFYYF